ncbi:hypothetical protein GA0070561_6027 [Micromonospora saelicesensis]|uniref:Uncharacterized protein n=1 Tax=Micromonospora saelicesensis TaxID=285676 RepID=A0A1C4ZYV7_9ACTN|nr:hypothetical protein GA0070561_6027 [Micromonospora saelicesensis]
MRSLTPRGLVAARPGRLPAHTSPVIGLSYSGTTVTESVYRRGRAVTRKQRAPARRDSPTRGKGFVSVDRHGPMPTWDTPYRPHPAQLKISPP